MELAWDDRTTIPSPSDSVVRNCVADLVGPLGLLVRLCRRLPPSPEDVPHVMVSADFRHERICNQEWLVQRRAHDRAAAADLRESLPAVSADGEPDRGVHRYRHPPTPS